MARMQGALGRRGAAVLLAAAVVGAILGVHGWSSRQSAGLPGALAGGSQAGTGAASSPPSPSATPSTSRSPAPSAGSPTPATAGPALSSQSFASYSFQVWPGSPSPAATNAMTGLTITVHKTSSGISVAAGVKGSPRTTAHSYAGGARVYVVEASMGDESGSTDYNLGDDGVVVTDAQGRILR